MVHEKVDIEDCELEDSLVLYDGKPFSGLLFSLYEDGSIFDEQEFQNGLPHGKSKEFYLSGLVKKTWLACNGRTQGKLVEFYENGGNRLEEIREFGVVLSSRRWDLDGNLTESNEVDQSSGIYAYVEECRRRRSDK